jgi:hypothetical protein
MSTPMDIDPPAASTSAENTIVDEIKGKGKEEKPRFEVKKVRIKRIKRIRFCLLINELFSGMPLLFGLGV